MACHQRIQVRYEREDGDPQDRYVGCGMCLGCRQEQARQWAVRMVHESLCHPFSWFVTLTYNDESLPENGSLDPSDVVSFVRRMRSFYADQWGRTDEPPPTFSYYICGEYGPRTLRPHYHAVCYGPDIPDRDYFRGAGRSMVWKSEILDQLWDRGFTEFSAVTTGSASYVAQYVRKKVAERDKGLEKLVDEDGKYFTHPRLYTRVCERTGELVAVVPEFARMSRRPAIGKRWIEKWWRDVYPRDYVVVDGVECRPPRYYDRWLEANHPEVWKEVRVSRAQADFDAHLEFSHEYPVFEDRWERERYSAGAHRKQAEAKVELFSQRSTL